MLTSVRNNQTRDVTQALVSNNEYQRKSYSGQKNGCYCTIRTITGRVLDMAGPFYANQNGAEIIKNLIEDWHGLCQLLNEGDKLFLDRGFQGAKDVLESNGKRN